jgi:hypothetical protein
MAKGVRVTPLPKWLRPKYEDATARADLERIEALANDVSAEAVNYKRWLTEDGVGIVAAEPPKVTAQRAYDRVEARKEHLEVERGATLVNAARMGYRLPVGKLARIDRDLERLEELSDLLWPALHPALFAGSEAEFEEAHGLKCRWPSCEARISRDESFETGGSCAAHRDVELLRAPPIRLDDEEAYIRHLVSRVAN